MDSKKQWLMRALALVTMGVGATLAGCGLNSNDSTPNEHRHSYQKTITDPTCVTQGFTSFVCGCGDNYLGDYKDPIPHVYENKVVGEEYFKSEATCTQAETYYLSCDCGKIGEETFTVGEKKVHTYETKWTYDETYHWYATTCGCDIQGAYAPHQGKDGVCIDCGAEVESSEDNPTEHIHEYNKTITEPTCTMQGFTVFVCGCGYNYVGDYKDPIPHVYENKVVGEEYFKSEATCTQAETYYLSCDCGEKGEGTFTVGEKKAHSFEAKWTYDETHHWHEANCGCDEKDGYGEHIDADGFCSVCGVPTTSTVGVLYDLSADGTYAEVIGYDGTETRVKIASTYQGVPVTEIYNSAFSENASITEVIIPNSVTSIGEAAFYCCYSLTNVVIPDSVTSIGDAAFDGCDSLQFNEYGNAKYLGSAENAYFALVEVKNQNYSSYTIHSNTKIIADYAFSDCGRLISIQIPDSVTSIGARAFDYCSRLTSIEFKGTVAEWNAIEKVSGWNLGVPATEVVCKDGTVAL